MNELSKLLAKEAYAIKMQSFSLSLTECVEQAAQKLGVMDDNTKKLAENKIINAVDTAMLELGIR